jgi:hypothetical protein
MIVSVFIAVEENWAISTLFVEANTGEGIKTESTIKVMNAVMIRMSHVLSH